MQQCKGEKGKKYTSKQKIQTTQQTQNIDQEANKTMQSTTERKLDLENSNLEYQVEKYNSKQKEKKICSGVA